MADHVIEHSGDNSASMGLVLGAILLMLGLLFFFMFGGRSLFNYGSLGTGSGGTAPAPQTETNESGASGGEGGSINVDIPEDINVHTNPGQ